MATGQEPIRIGRRPPPFAVPPDRRSPARRLRGRLVAPVILWSAGHPPGGAGLTVSSVLVAEGQPARLLGLIDPTSAFWEAMQKTRAFVVHVCDGQQAGRKGLTYKAGYISLDPAAGELAGRSPP